MEREVAEVMWSGVAGRPCRWDELDDDEQAEWVEMARVGMAYIRRCSADFVGRFTFPKGSRPAPQDVIGVAKVIALEAIQQTTK